MAHPPLHVEDEEASRAAVLVNLERQCDEVSVMQAIYPDQVTGIDKDLLEAWRAAVAEPDITLLPAAAAAGNVTFAVTLRVPRTTDDADHAEVTVQFSFPTQYPEDCVCGVRIETKAISGMQKDAFHRQLAAYLAEDCVGSECALLALNYVEEHVADYFTPIQGSVAPSLAAPPPAVVVRSWVRFHHLLVGKTHVKERALVTAAKSFGLHGSIIYGTPGLVCVQGEEDDVTAFLSECRGTIGKKPEVVTTDEILPSTSSNSHEKRGRAGLVELPMSHLEALLVEQGLGDRRREILGLE